MLKKMPEKTFGIKIGRSSLIYFAILLTLMGLVSVACGVKAGENRPARPQGQSGEFHRTPINFLEVVDITITKTESGCEVTPSELELNQSRVRFSIQNSPTSTGPANFAIPGLEISGASGPGGFAGSSTIDIDIAPGPRPNRDFNVTNSGTFDIMCDGEKVGTVTVAEV